MFLETTKLRDEDEWWGKTKLEPKNGGKEKTKLKVWRTRKDKG